MKYLKADLWNRYNSEIKEEYENAKVQWEKNNKEYSSIFLKVKNKLPKYFLKIYMKEHGFHDYHLKSFEIIHGDEGFKSPIEVSLVIEYGEKSWNIIYKGVSKVEINYEEKFDDSINGRKIYSGFDDYGYNEFLEINDNVLSHEILFASDATILIHFKKISIKKIITDK